MYQNMSESSSPGSDTPANQSPGVLVPASLRPRGVSFFYLNFENSVASLFLLNIDFSKSFTHTHLVVRDYFSLKRTHLDFWLSHPKTVLQFDKKKHFLEKIA